MESRKRKQPNEYPLFAIRLSKGQIETLTETIDQVRNSLNQRLDKKTDKLWMKNEIVYEALVLGLPMLKKKKPTK